MSQIRIAQAARLLGVSDDTMRRWADAGRVVAQQDASGKLVIDGASLAAFAQGQAAANNPGALDTRSSHRSARNHFTGLVVNVTSDKVMSQVELQCGPYRVVSLISTEAVGELGLEPGTVATAVVKSTNVTIEA